MTVHFDAGALRRVWPAALLGLCLALSQAVARAQTTLVMASTTSTEQSGLFGHLLPAFKAASGLDVKVVALGTGQALDEQARRLSLARGLVDIGREDGIRGDADLRQHASDRLADLQQHAAGLWQHHGSPSEQPARREVRARFQSVSDH